METATIRLAIAGKDLSITLPTVEGMKLRLVSAVMAETTRTWQLMEAIKAAGVDSAGRLGRAWFDVDTATAPLRHGIAGDNLLVAITNALGDQILAEISDRTSGLSRRASITLPLLTTALPHPQTSRLNASSVDGQPSATLHDWQVRCLRALDHRYNTGWLDQISRDLLRIEHAVVGSAVETLLLKLFHCSPRRSTPDEIEQALSARAMKKGLVVWTLKQPDGWVKRPTDPVSRLQELVWALYDAHQFGLQAAGEIATALSMLITDVDSHRELTSVSYCGIKCYARAKAVEILLPEGLVTTVKDFLIRSTTRQTDV